MSIPQQPHRHNRKRQTHRRRNAYHPLPSREEQVVYDRQIATRLLNLACQGVKIDPTVIHSPGARKMVETKLQPEVFAAFLSCRRLTGEPIDIDGVRESYPVAYDKFVAMLPEHAKAAYGIVPCPEADIRRRCRDREQRRRELVGQ